MSAEAQAYLVESIIPQNALTLFFAPSGSGKTFGALSLGLSLATATPWYGQAVQGGDVVYICGEGKSGIRKRIKAWEAHFNVSITGAPFYITSGAADFSDATSVTEVKNAIDQLEIQPKLIIIDTLSRNTSGDENDSKEMAAFIKALDELKDCYGASILLVHHTGHNEKTRARGSSVLKAAMDSEFKFEKTGNLILFTCTKMKDAVEPKPKQFELKSIIVSGQHLQMDAVLVEVGLTSLSSLNVPSLAPQNQKALLVLQQYPSGISKEAFCEQLVRDKIMNCQPENQRRIFDRIIAALIAAGVISETSNSLQANVRTTLGQGQD